MAGTTTGLDQESGITNDSQAENAGVYEWIGVMKAFGGIIVEGSMLTQC